VTVTGNRFLTILLIASLFHAVPAHAELIIEAQLTPAKAIVGEPVTLTITVTGANAPVEKPELPSFTYFRAYSQGHSQEISISGGQMTSRSVFSYVLIPDTVGRHSLGQIELVIGGRIYRTAELDVEVGEPVAGTPFQKAKPSPAPLPVLPPTRSLPPEYMAGQEIFVRPWVDKDEVYLGEPIYLTYTIYTRVSATFKGFSEEPALKGFWVEEFPPQQTVRQQEKWLGNYRYVVADVRILALFPTETGLYNLEPGVLNVDIERRQVDPFDQFVSWDIFGRRRVSRRRRQPLMVTTVPKLLATQTIPIRVLPLTEEGRPRDFSGAVGKYRLEAAVDQRRVEVGEPVTYTLKLTGEGNLNTVELPKLPEIDHFKSYDSSESLNMRTDRLVVEGEKIKQTVLIPKKEGDYRIPPLEFSYFDTGSHRYRRIKTQEIVLKILPGEKPVTEVVPPELAPLPEEVELIGEDIRFVKHAPGRWVTERTFLFSRGSYWVAVSVLFLAGPLVIALAHLVERLLKKEGGARFRRSYRVARRRLGEAKSHLKVGQEREFYESTAKALYGYFADRLNLEPGAIGWSVLQERLSGKVSEEDMGGLKVLFEKMDFSRYAMGETNLENMKADYESAARTISRFEGSRL